MESKILKKYIGKEVILIYDDGGPKSKLGTIISIDEFLFEFSNVLLEGKTSVLNVMRIINIIPKEIKDGG